MYELSGGEWLESLTLTADDGVAGDGFGREVAVIDARFVAVGAETADAAGVDSGAVYMYELSVPSPNVELTNASASTKPLHVDLIGGLRRRK